MGKSFLRFATVLVMVLGFLLSPAYGAEDVEVLITKGDTLVHICEKYLDDPSEWPQVATVNQLDDPHWIYPGQKIIIPAELLRGIPSDGRVTFLKGAVEVQWSGHGAWEPLGIEGIVPQGSTVRTGSDSALEVTFEDGSSLFLRSDTTVGMAKLTKRGGVRLFQELFLESGRVFSRIKKATGKEPRYRIRTPSTIAAARGTEFRVSHDRKSVTRVEVLQGQVVAGARQRRVPLKEGEGTVVSMGRQPTPPAKLLSPPVHINPEPLYKKMPLEFRFNRVEGAVAFRVILGRDRDFKDIIHEGMIRPYELLRVEPLDDGSYFMQASSIDSLGLEGIPSEPFPVNVRTNPIPPFVQSPVDGTEYKTVTMEFSWLQVEDAAKYQMEIAEDPDFLHVVDEKELVRKAGYKTKVLLPRTYFFRVRSIAADNYVGVWSDTIRFSLLQPPPAPPSEPPKKGKKEINIRWKDLGEGISYHFQLARDKDFEEVLLDRMVERSQYAFPKPRKPGQYFVRVSAVKADGFEGHFSTPQSFEIGCFEW